MIKLSCRCFGEPQSFLYFNASNCFCSAVQSGSSWSTEVFPVTAGKAWTAAQILSESEGRLMMKICHSQSVPRPEAAQGGCQFHAVTAKPVLSLQTCVQQSLCACARPFVYVSALTIFMHMHINVCITNIMNMHSILWIHKCVLLLLYPNLNPWNNDWVYECVLVCVHASTFGYVSAWMSCVCRWDNLAEHRLRIWSIDLRFAGSLGVSELWCCHFSKPPPFRRRVANIVTHTAAGHPGNTRGNWNQQFSPWKWDKNIVIVCCHH